MSDRRAPSRGKKRTAAFARIYDRGSALKSRAKTEMCNNILAQGWCKFGDECTYAHRETELIVQECAFGETCRLKDSKTNPCKFSHGNSPGAVKKIKLREIRAQTKEEKMVSPMPSPPAYSEVHIEELCASIQSRIFFSLDCGALLAELIWKIGADWDVFQQWFDRERKRSKDRREEPVSVWRLSERFPALVKTELIRAHGASFERQDLIRLGIRCMNPACWEIVAEGNLEFLKWAHRQAKIKERKFWDKRACSIAAEKDYLECLQYAHEFGCPWDEDTCYAAAYAGNLECLRYAYERDCPWNGLEICKVAARKGHLDCLVYARENGCPWDEEVCLGAARNGYLDCLRYAHEQGCPWTREVCKLAAKNGHLDCLQYAREQGCLK